MNEKAPILLELVQVTKKYRSGEEELTVVDNLSLEIPAGKTMAITGPSGSGKSTLLNLIAGLDRVSQGEIYLQGVSLGDWKDESLAQWRRQEVGFIFQDFRLIESFTALENVSLPLEILGEKTNLAQEKAKELLKELGLEYRLQHFPGQLSGGEQQRVAIARAYAHHPKIILADEPTGNLDPHTSNQVMKNLLNINKTRNTTLVVVTHDTSVAQLMEKIVSLTNGRISHDE